MPGMNTANSKAAAGDSAARTNNERQGVIVEFVREGSFLLSTTSRCGDHYYYYF